MFGCHFNYLLFQKKKKKKIFIFLIGRGEFRFKPTFFSVYLIQFLTKKRKKKEKKRTQNLENAVIKQLTTNC